MSKSYDEFKHQKEQFHKRQSRLREELTEKETTKKQLQEKFDRTVIQQGSTVEVEEKLSAVDREIVFLQRKASLISSEETLKQHLRPYLQAVLQENEDKMAKLRNEWDGLKEKFEQARENYLTLLDESREINEKAKEIQREYEQAQEHLDLAQYLPGPIGDDVLCDLHKGLIFWDNQQIAERFSGKRVIIRNRRRNGK